MRSERLLLVQAASVGQLPLLCRWLAFRNGRTRKGQRQPIALSARRCAAALARLSDIQLAELRWRGLAPSLGGALEPHHPFVPSPRAWVAPVGRGARHIFEPVEQRTLYQLADGQVLRLRPGELAVLARAGYPSTVDELLAVLWAHIAPAHPRLPRPPTALKRWAEPTHGTLTLAIGVLDPDVWQGAAFVAAWLHHALSRLF